MSQPTLTTSHQVSQPFFVAGGTLRRDSPSYVRRSADTELLETLAAGGYCYVLTSRQMGKSSLMVRIAAALRERGTAVAVLDLTAMGQNVTPEQWYAGLALEIGSQLELEEPMEAYWTATQGGAPVRRFFGALRDVVLKRAPGPVAIFVDEIDAVRSLPFDADEFLAGIRECHNRRSQDPEFGRLAFCLLGVASPSDLIRDVRTTPFNVGRRVELDDFTLQEASVLEPGFACATCGFAKGEDAAKVLARVLYWTGGHPYLTQRLCQAVVNAGASEPLGRALVDRECDALFLSSRARERDDNLLFVRERLLRAEVDIAALLELYDKVWRGEAIRDDETNPLIGVMRLSGVVRVERGLLRVRNRIYRRVFDRRWIRDQMPGAELRRQRMAFLRGVARTGLVSGITLLVLVALAIAAWQSARQADRQAALLREAKQRAEENLMLARRNEEEAREAERRANALAADLAEALQALDMETIRAKRALAEAQKSRQEAVAAAARERRAAEEARQTRLQVSRLTERLAEQERADPGRDRTQAFGAVVQIIEQGTAAHLAGQFPRAEQAFLKGLREAEQAADQPRIAAFSSLLGMLYSSRNRDEEAIKYLEHALKALEVVGDPRSQVEVLLQMAHLQSRANRRDAARAAFEKAMRIARQSGDAMLLRRVRSIPMRPPAPPPGP